MKGQLIRTKDSVVGVAQCSNGNLGVVIKMEPSKDDLRDLKANGLRKVQYKICPFEMGLTQDGCDYVDSNDNKWKILDTNCE